MLLKSKKFIKNFYGFTMLELLVSVSIIGLTMTIGIVNYRSHERSSGLSSVVSEFRSVARQAQMRVLNGELSNGSKPVGGYGLLINSTEYYLIANHDDNTNCNSGNEIIIEKIVLSNNVLIDQSNTCVIFTFPETVTYINGSASGQLDILFTQSGSGESKTVSIEAPVGRININ